MQNREAGSLAYCGYGWAASHHGEILQGVFEANDGMLHRGLVTLPCPSYSTIASFIPSFRSRTIRVTPAWKTKAAAAARLALDYFGMPLQGGKLNLEGNVPIGWGLGSSTSDVIATIEAVRDCFHCAMTPEITAALAINAEIASDPLMYGNEALLFAQREGVVLERLGGPLPALDVVGFNTDRSHEGIDTLAFDPADYDWVECESFRPLLGLLRTAVNNCDPTLLAVVASSSAWVNERHLAAINLAAVDDLTNSVGGLGFQVAHSGTVVGLLFQTDDPMKGERIEEAIIKGRELGFELTASFRTR